MRVIEVDAFESLKGNWNSLLERNLLGNNIFLTWEWLSTWWKHFGNGRRLSLLLVEDADKILAIAPLMISKYKMPGFGNIKKIELVGTRQSDYNSFIVLDRELECLKLITNYLSEMSADWDWVELVDVPETEYISQPIFSGIPTDLKVKSRICNVCPYLSLPDSFESLMKGFSSNMRQDLKKKMRRLQKNFQIELKKFDETSWSITESIDIFMGLHQKKWELAGFSGTFYEQEMRNFHTDIAKIFANEGWLGLYFLMANGEPIAGHYSFEYFKKIYYYLSGYLPQHSVYSPGSLIILLVLQRCINNGIVEYDLMRGEEAYKRRWTDSCRKNYQIRLVRNNFHSKFYDWVTWSKAIEGLAQRFKVSLNQG